MVDAWLASCKHIEAVGLLQWFQFFWFEFELSLFGLSECFFILGLENAMLYIVEAVVISVVSVVIILVYYLCYFMHLASEVDGFRFLCDLVLST